MFLVDCLSRVFGCNRPNLDKATFCHGTTFSTLYLICKQVGEEQNCLLPFGKLAKRRVPVFAGECTSESQCLGIRDKAINQTCTSWNYIYRYPVSFDKYAKPFAFDINVTKEKIDDLIKGFRNYKGGFPPYDSTSHGWNNVTLLMRQLRAWDEEGFQKTYAPDLKEWVKFAISDLERQRGTSTIEEYDSVLQKMRDFEKELSDPVFFRVSQIDKENIKKNFPILFITDLRDDDYVGAREVGYSRNMQLGREIKWIATEPQHVEEVSRFIKQKNLAGRVSVISTEVLKKKYL